jgi:hypothetical protein
MQVDLHINFIWCRVVIRSEVWDKDSEDMIRRPIGDVGKDFWMLVNNKVEIDPIDGSSL